jgi:ABC-type transport system involved in cytochrome bd biosynthesis fused ATPase/permease subunit
MVSRKQHSSAFEPKDDDRGWASGARKPTLINLFLRFFEPEGGRILIDGQDVASVTRRACVRRSPW